MSRLNDDDRYYTYVGLFGDEHEIDKRSWEHVLMQFVTGVFWLAIGLPVFVVGCLILLHGIGVI